MGRHESSGLGTVLFAAAAGFVAGILLAPKSGAETRKEIQKKGRYYKKQADHGLEVAKDTVKTSRKEFQTVADEVVKDAKELSSDAKVRAKRTAEHAKTSARNVETNAREAWSGHADAAPKRKPGSSSN